MRLRRLALPALFLLPVIVPADKTEVLSSKHNLSVTGSPIRSNEPDACIFCHTPHTSMVNVTPLWNHALSTQVYSTYASSTYDSGPGTPSAGSSKMCLSCHDGTVALGLTVSKGLIATAGVMRAGAVLGTNLSNDHPAGMQPGGAARVDDGQLAVSLFQNPPVSRDPAIKLPGGRIECTTCHEPHRQSIDAVAQRFLARPNNGGAMCLACHDPGRPQPSRLNGWTAGAHAVFTNGVPAGGQFGLYGAVAANACQNCHVPHGAAAGPRLLRGTEEAACSPCHTGANVSPALRNVMGEFSKLYKHPVQLAGIHDPAESISPVNAARHSECADCHNSHAAAATGGAANPPGLVSALLGVTGYTGTTALRPAQNEFEVCFKCHSGSANKPQGVTYTSFGRTPFRVSYSGTTDPFNEQPKFASLVSRHNVTSARQRTAAQVPSLRAAILTLNGTVGRSLSTASYIYCTDCHAGDQARKSTGTGPNGPHGSTWNHLLERRYDLEQPPGRTSFAGGTAGTAALCNKCHDVDNSVVQNRSFRDHNKHVVGAATSCSTCHDPHGIVGGNLTNNYALINFDTAVVTPSSSGILRYESNGAGTLTGRCYLSCHGKNHNPLSY
jgi:predicted CXXCH cytochrome family protein